MNISNWLQINIKDRLSFYKASRAAGKYQRSKKECLFFASRLVLEDINSDVFILSL